MPTALIVLVFALAALRPTPDYDRLAGTWVAETPSQTALLHFAPDRDRAAMGRYRMESAGDGGSEGGRYSLHLRGPSIQEARLEIIVLIPESRDDRRAHPLRVVSLTDSTLTVQACAFVCGKHTRVTYRRR